MLTGNNNRTFHITCNHCDSLFSEIIPSTAPGIVMKYLKEYGEYENYSVTCPFCGTIEVFNMNIPVNETDEGFKTGELPEKEEIQRYYVRLLQRLVREDLIQ